MSENTAEIYDSDYYITGKQSGKSLYENYRWLPDLTLPMVHWITSHLNIRPCDTILDFGCARGYTVKALRQLGYEAWGVDHSEWAIANADPDVTQFVAQRTLPPRPFDFILAKDVLEHVPDGPLQSLLSSFADNARRGVFFVVPLSPADGLPYVVPEYELDVTHIQRLTLDSWLRMARDAFGDRWMVRAGYLMPGIKDNYSSFVDGNGFVEAVRVKS